MTAIASIVVPTDFSSSARGALDYGLGLAESFQSSVVLVHAWSAPAYVEADAFVGTSEGGHAFMALAEQQSQAELDALLAHCRQAVPAELSEHIQAVNRPGQAAHVILEVAEEFSADLIVMGTHGRSGLSHMLLGSVTEKVMRRAACPVLTVRTTPTA